MCILRNSKDLLEYTQSRSLSSSNIIKTFDFSTLYTTIPHSKLKDRLRELVQLCFLKNNGQCRYKYIVLGRDKSYFEIKDTTDTDKSASYIDLYIEMDSEGRFRTKLYDNRDDFNFPIVNIPFTIVYKYVAKFYQHLHIPQLIRTFQSLWFLSEFP